MRIGILGGTFNPIHFGHIFPAREAVQKLKLDKIIFIPAYSPPHKPDEIILSAHHRINMINLAHEDFPCFELSKIEIDRKGVSYSIDTINLLKEQWKSDVFFLSWELMLFRKLISGKMPNVY